MLDLRDHREILCDFDGTITKVDVVDTFLDRFASAEWLEIESLWRKKLIGSRECLSRQVLCIPPLSSQTMREFIDSIEIDPSFIEFAQSTARGRITIVSDGFDVFIRGILEKHELTNIRYFSNKLVSTIGPSGFKAEFPYADPDCKTAAGTCKCKLARELSPGTPFSFIGDGQSDFCVSHQAGTVYAKGKLVTYCREQGIPHVEFHTFKELIDNVQHLSAINANRGAV